jgi:hypothetical protein
MGFMSRLEETIPDSVKALLLGTAVFSASTEHAFGWQETTLPERPAAAATFDPARRDSSSAEVVIFPQTKGFSELWTADCPVYLSASLEHIPHMSDETASLNRILSKEYPDWSVVVLARNDAANRGFFGSRTQKGDSAQTVEILRGLESLKRFDSDQNVIILEQSATRPLEVTSTILLARSQRGLSVEEAPGLSYFTQRLNTAVRNEVPLSTAVLNSIQEVREIVHQKQRAQDAENQARLQTAKIKFAQEQESIATSLTQLKKTFGAYSDERLLNAFEEKSAEITERSRVAGENITADKIQEIDQQYGMLANEIQSLTKSAKEFGQGLKSLEEFRQFIEVNRSKWYLDERGHQAIDSSTKFAEELEQSLYTLKISVDDLGAKVNEGAVWLENEIEADQSNEMLGIVLGVPVTLLATGLTLVTGYNLAGTVIQKARFERKKAQERKAHVNGIQEETTKLLDTVDAALAAKRTMLIDTMIPEPVRVDRQLELGLESSTDLQTTAIKAWWVLKKMQEIAAEARTCSRSKDLNDLNRARALVSTARVNVSEDDGLGFLDQVSRWRSEVALSAPRDFTPATVSFDSLHEEFVKLAEQCQRMTRVEDVLDSEHS